jgi:hypothetical protein
VMLVLSNVMLVLSDFLYILNLNNNKKFRILSNVIVSTIICEVGTIMCDIGTINVRFFRLEIPYPHKYYRITQKLEMFFVSKKAYNCTLSR